MIKNVETLDRELRFSCNLNASNLSVCVGMNNNLTHMSAYLNLSMCVRDASHMSACENSSHCPQVGVCFKVMLLPTAFLSSTPTHSALVLRLY